MVRLSGGRHFAQLPPARFAGQAMTYDEQAAGRRVLEEELRDLLEREDVNPVAVALQIGNGGFALGITGRLDPAPLAERG